MSQAILEATEPEAENIKVEVENLFAQMQLLNEQRQQDQERIDRLKVETRAIAADTDAVLSRLSNPQR